MKFLTFVEIDLRKIIPFLLGIFAIAIVGFQGITFKILSGIKGDLVTQAAQSGTTMEEFLGTIDKLSLQSVMDQMPFGILLLLFIALFLILFGFYIWYKEWFGASKRIYTLLSIKGSRFRIFTSKLVVFLFIFIAFYGVVLLNLYLSGLMMEFVLPKGAIADNLVQNMILHSRLLPYLLPVSVSTLLFKLAFITMMFAILSVFVLLDRSKRIWGMITGFVYIIGSIVLFFYLNSFYLYTMERIYVNWAFVGVFLFISTALSYYLLKKKVSI